MSIGGHWQRIRAVMLVLCIGLTAGCNINPFQLGGGAGDGGPGGGDGGGNVNDGGLDGDGGGGGADADTSDFDAGCVVRA